MLVAKMLDAPPDVGNGRCKGPGVRARLVKSGEDKRSRCVWKPVGPVRVKDEDQEAARQVGEDQEGDLGRWVGGFQHQQQDTFWRNPRKRAQEEAGAAVGR